MEQNIENTIEEYFLNLPQEVESRLSGPWRKELSYQLKRNEVPEEHYDEIKDEVFLNLAGIKSTEETCDSIRQILPLDSKTLDALCEDLKYKVLVEEVEETDIPTESQVGVDIIKDEPVKEIDKQESFGETPSESRSGVDIIPEEKEENAISKPSPGRDSIIQGVEHPEESAKIEDAAKRGEKYNPVASKLRGSTVGTEKKAPQYKGSDPYREPIK